MQQQGERKDKGERGKEQAAGREEVAVSRPGPAGSDSAGAGTLEGNTTLQSDKKRAF